MRENNINLNELILITQYPFECVIARAVPEAIFFIFPKMRLLRHACLTARQARNDGLVISGIPQHI
jgi:hypothetical protein